MHNFLMTIVILIVLASNFCYAADVKMEKEFSDGTCYMSIGGEIDRQTPIRIQELVKRHNCRNEINCSLNSGGGDAIAAMQCGRLFRRMGARTWVPYKTSQCASACVLMFVGGAYREGSGKIGFHRPFGTVNTASSLESQRNFDAINKKIAEYLSEMNISPRVLDIMNSRSPGDIKWYEMRSKADREQLKELLVIGVDPAYEDLNASRFAMTLGISKEELYRRYQKANAVCGKEEDVSDMDEYSRYVKCRAKIISPELLRNFDKK